MAVTVDGVTLTELAGVAVAVGLAVAVELAVAAGLAVAVGLAEAPAELVGVAVELEHPARIRSPVPAMATATTIRQNVF
jgi:hypothetical protein